MQSLYVPLLVNPMTKTNYFFVPSSKTFVTSFYKTKCKLLDLKFRVVSLDLVILVDTSRRNLHKNTKVGLLRLHLYFNTVIVYIYIHSIGNNNDNDNHKHNVTY